MRNILVILLVVSLLVGTFCVMEGFQEISDGKELVFDEIFGDTIADPSPCGGGSDGSGGGQPG